ncbi:MAG: hypothetical protein IJU79_01565 [Desulfovibrionaceae bacterium]|nr:hypothetical protein [Desulfovibrionaceae bacterium]
MFSEADSKRQDAAFEQLKEEFSRLEQQEKALRKALGQPEEGTLDFDPNDVPAEVKKMCEEAQARAKREGAARAAQFESEFQTAATPTGAARPGGRRQGIMRI